MFWYSTNPSHTLQLYRVTGPLPGRKRSESTSIVLIDVLNSQLALELVHARRPRLEAGGLGVGSGQLVLEERGNVNSLMEFPIFALSTERQIWRSSRDQQ